MSHNKLTDPELQEDYVTNAMVWEALQVTNATLGRSSFIKYTDDGSVSRDIYKECKYPATNSITVKDYKDKFDRHAIANRVVQVLPDETWQITPEIYEDKDPDTTTNFEDAWENLNKKLQGDSHFKREEGSPIWEYLHRIDELSGVGSFGILFLGMDDGKELHEELDDGEYKDSEKGPQLKFLRAFDQSCVQITAYDTNPSSERYGFPTMYNITFANPTENVDGGVGAQEINRNVHWSRVIHIADNIHGNEIFGVPRMQPVYNRILDLEKLLPGSAEMYWKGAFPGISFETHPHLGQAATIDTSKLKSTIQKYMEGLQRYVSLKGMAAKSLAPQVVDPGPQVMVQIEAICIQLGCPKRIFMGSERGELASSQDTENWNDRIKFRQNMYVTPRVIVPFVDRLIKLGVLPAPGEEGYKIKWPTLESLSQSERADIANKQVHALTKYVAGDVEMAMSLPDFLQRFLQMDKEEAQEVVEAAVKAFGESEDRDLQRQIREGKILKDATPPIFTADDKDKLLQSDFKQTTVKDALADDEDKGLDDPSAAKSKTKTPLQKA